jgi:hypothetical protein
VDEFDISSERVPFNADGSACNPCCRRLVRTLILGRISAAPKYNYSVQDLLCGFRAIQRLVERGRLWSDDNVPVGGANSAAVVTQKAYLLVITRGVPMEHGKQHWLRLSVIGKNLTAEYS